MLAPATLILFTGTAFAVCMTPGPDMIFCLSRGVGNGTRAGILAAAGACSGLYIYALLTTLGITSVFLYSPVAYHVLRLTGAAYLLWLAWKAFHTPNLFYVKKQATTVPPKFFAFFAEGLLNGLLNPKSAVFFLALFPQFINPAHGSVVMQSLTLVTILAGVNFTIIALLCLGAGRFGQWLGHHPRWARVQSMAVATVFTGLAARLALQSRP